VPSLAQHGTVRLYREAPKDLRRSACSFSYRHIYITLYICQYVFTSANSMLSTSACKLASTIFSLTPTVLHSSVPSVDCSRTRVFAAVPVAESRIRTL